MFRRKCYIEPTCRTVHGGRDGGGVTPLPHFYHHYLLSPLHNFSHIYFSPFCPSSSLRYHVIVLEWRHMRAPTFRNMAAGLIAQTQMAVRRVVASWRQGVVLETAALWLSMRRWLTRRVAVRVRLLHTFVLNHVTCMCNHSWPNGSPGLDQSYFWKRYSVPVRIYVVMLHGVL